MDLFLFFLWFYCHIHLTYIEAKNCTLRVNMQLSMLAMVEDTPVISVRRLQRMHGRVLMDQLDNTTTEQECPSRYHSRGI